MRQLRNHGSIKLNLKVEGLEIIAVCLNVDTDATKVVRGTIKTGMNGLATCTPTKLFVGTNTALCEGKEKKLDCPKPPHPLPKAMKPKSRASIAAVACSFIL